jgi:hypothetical protein
MTEKITVAITQLDESMSSGGIDREILTGVFAAKRTSAPELEVKKEGGMLRVRRKPVGSIEVDEAVEELGEEAIEQPVEK